MANGLIEATCALIFDGQEFIITVWAGIVIGSSGSHVCR